jgi:hypothetical protein
MPQRHKRSGPAPAEPGVVELPGRVVCTDRGQHAEARITSFGEVQEPREDRAMVLQMTPSWDVLANIGPGSPTTYRFSCRRCGRDVPLQEQTLFAAVDALRRAQGPGKRLILDISLICLRLLAR